MNQIIIILALVFCTLLNLSAIRANENVVPVVFWGKDGNTPTAPVLQITGEKAFANLLSENFDEDDHLLIFVEKSLHPEDFKSFKSADESFKSKLATLKGDSALSYFLFVRNPVQAIKNLYPNAAEISAADFSSDMLPNNKVIIITWDETNNSKNIKEHVLKAFEIYNKASETNDHVTGLLTGLKGSWVETSAEDIELSRKARAVTTTTTDSRVLYHTNNTLLYVNSSIILSANGTEVSFSTGTFTDSLSDNVIMATLTGSGVTINMNLTSSAGYWYLVYLTVTYNGQETNLTVQNVYAPLQFSYTCNNTVFYASGNTDYYLSLPGFQLQPFFGVTHDTTFSDPYNCVGFTTIPIWSGLFVTFMLVLIMTIALIFMLDIRTMDRFDDPKGKTIAVNVSE